MHEDQQTESFFRFQLDSIMKEIDLIDHAIGRLDEILLRNRNWGTTLWAGLIAILLQGNFDRYLLLTAVVIPMIFWLIDIRWKMALLRCSARQRRISEFLNSDALHELFKTGQPLPITLLDPTGESLPLKNWDYFVAAARYKDTFIFFPAQILGTLLLYFLH